jgi:hypothetical protein
MRTHQAHSAVATVNNVDSIRDTRIVMDVMVSGDQRRFKMPCLDAYANQGGIRAPCDLTTKTPPGFHADIDCSAESSMSPKQTAVSVPPRHLEYSRPAADDRFH